MHFFPPALRALTCRWAAWIGTGAVSALPVVLAAQPARAQEAATTLSPVVVTATRTEKTVEDTPVRTELVTREEIARTHARTLKQALENVPGLQMREVRGKSGYEVSLQGLTSDQVLVLIDGLPITASTGSTVDLSQYLIGDIDHIEVVKGATSAQYGSSAMGGVINVITRRIEPGFSGAAALDAGSRGSQNASGGSGHPASRHARVRLEGGSETLRLRLTGDTLKDDGFGVDPAAWSRQGDAVQRRQIAARMAWLPSRVGEFWLDAGRYTEDDEQRYLYYVPPNNVPQRKFEAITRDRLGAGGQWTFGNGLRAQVKGVDERYDSHSRAFSNSAQVGDRLADQRTRHLTAQVDLPAWRRQLWQFGADLHEERLMQTVDGVAELEGNGSAKRSSRELFVQNDILFDDTWELLLGLRWQDDSDFGGHVAPKAALKAHLLRGERWNGVLRAAYGQGYRVPNLKERHFRFDHSALGYMVVGNPRLEPESSDSFQLGGTLSLRNTLSIEVNAFYNDVDDLIQTDMNNVSTVNGIATYTYRNVARARTSGLETALNWQATPTLALSAAYTYTRTRDLDLGGELTRRPRDIARIGLDWQPREGTTLALRGRYQSSELVDSASQARSPSWAALDVSLNQSLGHGLTAFAGINNLTDRQRDFADPNDFGPLSGRYVYLGLRYRFGDGR